MQQNMSLIVETKKVLRAKTLRTSGREDRTRTCSRRFWRAFWVFFYFYFIL